MANGLLIGNDAVDYRWDVEDIQIEFPVFEAVKENGETRETLVGTTGHQARLDAPVEDRIRAVPSQVVEPDSELLKGLRVGPPAFGADALKLKLSHDTLSKHFYARRVGRETIGLVQPEVALDFACGFGDDGDTCSYRLSRAPVVPGPDFELPRTWEGLDPHVQAMDATHSVLVFIGDVMPETCQPHMIVNPWMNKLVEVYSVAGQTLTLKSGLLGRLKPGQRVLVLYAFEQIETLESIARKLQRGTIHLEAGALAKAKGAGADADLLSSTCSADHGARYATAGPSGTIDEEATRTDGKTVPVDWLDLYLYNNDREDVARPGETPQAAKTIELKEGAFLRVPRAKNLFGNPVFAKGVRAATIYKQDVIIRFLPKDGERIWEAEDLPDRVHVYGFLEPDPAEGEIDRIQNELKEQAKTGEVGLAEVQRALDPKNVARRARRRRTRDPWLIGGETNRVGWGMATVTMTHRHGVWGTWNQGFTKIDMAKKAGLPPAEYCGSIQNWIVFDGAYADFLKAFEGKAPDEKVQVMGVMHKNPLQAGNRKGLSLSWNDLKTPDPKLTHVGPTQIYTRKDGQCCVIASLPIADYAEIRKKKDWGAGKNQLRFGEDRIDRAVNVGKYVKASAFAFDHRLFKRCQNASVSVGYMEWQYRYTPFVKRVMVTKEESGFEVVERSPDLISTFVFRMQAHWIRIHEVLSKTHSLYVPGVVEKSFDAKEIKSLFGNRPLAEEEVELLAKRLRAWNKEVKKHPDHKPTFAEFIDFSLTADVNTLLVNVTRQKQATRTSGLGATARCQVQGPDGGPIRIMPLELTEVLLALTNTQQNKTVGQQIEACLGGGDLEYIDDYRATLNDLHDRGRVAQMRAAAKEREKDAWAFLLKKVEAADQSGARMRIQVFAMVLKMMRKAANVAAEAGNLLKAGGVEMGGKTRAALLAASILSEVPPEFFHKDNELWVMILRTLLQVSEDDMKFYTGDGGGGSSFGVTKESVKSSRQRPTTINDDYKKLRGLDSDFTNYSALIFTDEGKDLREAKEKEKGRRRFDQAELDAAALEAKKESGKSFGTMREVHEHLKQRAGKARTSRTDASDLVKADGGYAYDLGTFLHRVFVNVKFSHETKIEKSFFWWILMFTVSARLKGEFSGEVGGQFRSGFGVRQYLSKLVGGLTSKAIIYYGTSDQAKTHRDFLATQGLTLLTPATIEAHLQRDPTGPKEGGISTAFADWSDFRGAKADPGKRSLLLSGLNFFRAEGERCVNILLCPKEHKSEVEGLGYLKVEHGAGFEKAVQKLGGAFSWSDVKWSDWAQATGIRTFHLEASRKSLDFVLSGAPQTVWETPGGLLEEIRKKTVVILRGGDADLQKEIEGVLDAAYVLEEGGATKRLRRTRWDRFSAANWTEFQNDASDLQTILLTEAEAKQKAGEIRAADGKVQVIVDDVPSGWKEWQLYRTRREDLLALKPPFFYANIGAELAVGFGLRVEPAWQLAINELQGALGELGKYLQYVQVYGEGDLTFAFGFEFGTEKNTKMHIGFSSSIVFHLFGFQRKVVLFQAKLFEHDLTSGEIAGWPDGTYTLLDAQFQVDKIVLRPAAQLSG